MVKNKLERVVLSALMLCYIYAYMHAYDKSQWLRSLDSRHMKNACLSVPRDRAPNRGVKVVPARGSIVHGEGK